VGGKGGGGGGRTLVSVKEVTISGLHQRAGQIWPAIFLSKKEVRK